MVLFDQNFRLNETGLHVPYDVVSASEIDLEVTAWALIRNQIELLSDCLSVAVQTWAQMR